jgi:hypothetical protein
MLMPAGIAGSLHAWTESLHPRLAQKAGATPVDSTWRNTKQHKAPRLNAPSPNEITSILCGTNRRTKPRYLFFSVASTDTTRNECNAMQCKRRWVADLCLFVAAVMIVIVIVIAAIVAACHATPRQCGCRFLAERDPPTHLPPGDRAASTLMNRSVSGHRFDDDAVAPCH